MNKPERLANKLLENHNILGPPVPVDQIAKGLGVALSFEPFEGEEGISGILYRDGATKIIGINSAHAPTRQRFSIAHEIGHLVLHKKELFVDKVVQVNFRDGTSSLAVDREEIAANAFAAELLMPRKFVKREINKLLKKGTVLRKDDLIEALANIFKVSPQATEYRLNNLGILITE